MTIAIVTNRNVQRMKISSRIECKQNVLHYIDSSEWGYTIIV